MGNKELFKEQRKKSFLWLIEQLRVKLNDPQKREYDLMGFYTPSMQEEINLLYYRLYNLDEIVSIEIAEWVQQILFIFEYNYKYFNDKYINNFDNLLRELNFIGWHGMAIEDYEIFRGNNPMLPETKNAFIDHMNQKFEINIPHVEEVKAAEDAVKLALENGEQEEYDRLFCALKELQRDFGSLSSYLNGDLLGQYDMEYTKAQNRISLQEKTK